jgi:hypothetical protein
MIKKVNKVTSQTAARQNPLTESAPEANQDLNMIYLKSN